MPNERIASVARRLRMAEKSGRITPATLRSCADELEDCASEADGTAPIVAATGCGLVAIPHLGRIS